MAVIAETFASLRFHGDDLEPQALVGLLGKAPSDCVRKGDVIKSEKTGHERIAKTGRWGISAARRKPGNLDAQIEELLSQLSSDLAVWRQLAKYEPDLFVGLFLEQSNEGIELSANSLSLLADRGISLGLDVYGARPALRNIQIIDGADNATFSIFQATDSEFARIFPVNGQDMEVSEDFIQRVGEIEAKAIFDALWERPILKRDANGIHGTLYFDYQSKRRHVPTSKREVDFDDSAINHAQRKLFAEQR